MEKTLFEILLHNKAIHIDKLYRGELKFTCTCGKHTKIKINNLANKDYIRCNKCMTINKKCITDDIIDRQTTINNLTDYLTKTIGENYI